MSAAIQTVEPVSLRLAWDGMIKEQFYAWHKPCNFVEMLSMTGTGASRYKGERQ